MSFQKVTPTREPGREDQRLKRAPRARRRRRPRSAKEGGKGRGGGMPGRIYKGRHSAGSLLRSAESAAGTVGEEGGSRKGERQTAVTSAVQEPGYLFIRYPFSSSSPKPFPFPSSFFFLFGRRKPPERRRRAPFAPFRFPAYFPPPPFPPPAFSSQLGEVLPGGRPDGV